MIRAHASRQRGRHTASDHETPMQINPQQIVGPKRVLYEKARSLETRTKEYSMVVCVYVHPTASRSLHSINVRAYETSGCGGAYHYTNNIANNKRP